MGAALPFIAIAATGASAITGAIGAEKQASAEAASANYSAQVAENNNVLAQQNAKTAVAEGAVAQANQGMKTRAAVGGIKAAQAANNIDVNSGSAVDVRSSAASTGQLNALTIRSDAARTAYGYETQGISYQAQAGLDRAQAGFAKQAGNIGAVSSLLGGASSAGNMYAKFSSAGVDPFF